MREATQNVIKSIKQLHQFLNEKDYKDNINYQLKNYVITPEFIKEFKSYIDPAMISKQNLSKNAILELDKDGLFSSADWLIGIETKNIDVLVDAEFLSRHTEINAFDILKTHTEISDEIFNRYFNTITDIEIKKNLICNCKGKSVTQKILLDNINILDEMILKFDSIKKSLSAGDEETIKLILSTDRSIKLSTLLEMMTRYHIPKYIEENIENLTIENVDFAKEGTEYYTTLLKTIIVSYPVSVTNLLMPIIFDVAHDALINSDLLYTYLFECDNISEDTLIDIYLAFLQAGLRADFVAYCKNYGYRNALIALKLGN